MHLRVIKLEINFSVEALKARNMRPIPEHEIPLSILHTSLERFCNPKYSYEKLMKRKEMVAEQSKGDQLVPHTEDFFADVRGAGPSKKKVYIPESVPQTENLMAPTQKIVENTNKEVIKKTEPDSSLISEIEIPRQPKKRKADMEIRISQELEQESIQESKKAKTSRASNKWISDNDFEIIENYKNDKKSKEEKEKKS